MDCHPNDITGVVGWKRHEQLNESAAGRRRQDGGNFYIEEELQHFSWLKSEAIVPLFVTSDGVPKAIIVLGDPSPEKLDDHSEAVAKLRKLHLLLDTFYKLADLLADRTEKAERLSRLARVLPLMMTANSRLAFQRAICTLLTCREGFGFDRAMLFWLGNH